MITLDVNSPIVKELLEKLKETHKEVMSTDILECFENEYNCRVYSTDPMGITGKVVFYEGKTLTWLTLKNEK